jgi:hypothetical protein
MWMQIPEHPFLNTLNLLPKKIPLWKRDQQLVLIAVSQYLEKGRVINPLLWRNLT